jgi:hypothetical protein
MRVFLRRLKAPGCSHISNDISRSFPRKLFAFNMILQAKVATAVDVPVPWNLAASKVLPFRVV